MLSYPALSVNSRERWIPAFAGMTWEGAGMTWEGAGMTVGGRVGVMWEGAGYDVGEGELLIADC